LRATSTGSSADMNGARTTTHVMLHTDTFAAESAVGREIQKGYGLLVPGIANTEAPLLLIFGCAVPIYLLCMSIAVHNALRLNNFP
jgi:hypothetical protein